MWSTNRARADLPDHEQQLPTDRCLSGLKLHCLHAWKRYCLINSSASIPYGFAYSGPTVRHTGVKTKLAGNGLWVESVQGCLAVGCLELLHGKFLVTRGGVIHPFCSALHRRRNPGKAPCFWLGKKGFKVFGIEVFQQESKCSMKSRHLP